MSLNVPYDAGNIFAKIIRGHMPAAKIWEDENCLAFMDAFPQSDGHCLVIHKKAKATNLFDIDQTALTAMIHAVQKTALAVKSALQPDGVRIVQFNGKAAGQSVFHLHFHIIPVSEEHSLKDHGAAGQADLERLNEIAAKIRSAL